MARLKRRRNDNVVPISVADPMPASSPRIDGTCDAIARRAFELFCARGGEHGHDVEDWLQAEHEFLSGEQATA
jgi:hypothetical protein